MNIDKQYSQKVYREQNIANNNFKINTLNRLTQTKKENTTFHKYLDTRYSIKI